MAKIFAHRVHFTANLQRFWRNPPWSPSRSTNAIRGGLPRAMTIRPRPDRAAARGIFPWLSAAGGTSSGATPPPRRPPLSTILPVSWSPTFAPPTPCPKPAPKKSAAPQTFRYAPKKVPTLTAGNHPTPPLRQPHPPVPCTISWRGVCNLCYRWVSGDNGWRGVACGGGLIVGRGIVSHSDTLLMV